MSEIEWTDDTINPVGGCEHASPGCLHCYAEVDARGLTKRAGEAIRRRYLPLIGPAGRWARGEDGKPVFAIWPSVVRKMIDASGRVRQGDGFRRKRWFLGSMADLFHPGRPAEDVHVVLGALTANLHRPIWQLVTKHPARAVEMLELQAADTVRSLDTTIQWLREHGEDVKRYGFNRPTRWLLTSVENDEWAKRRVPEVIKARPFVDVIGLSAEPLLGPINLRPWLPKLDWVIVGGESGTGARRCDAIWIRDIIAQCREAKVSVFCKQLGGNPWEGEVARDMIVEPSRDMGGGMRSVARRAPIVERKGGNMDEWPEDLRVRQWPA